MNKAMLLAAGFALAVSGAGADMHTGKGAQEKAQEEESSATQRGEPGAGGMTERSRERPARDGAAATGAPAPSKETMDRQALLDLSRSMEQMRDMTQTMSRIMREERSLEQAHTREMAQIMERLSTQMKDMSQQMAQGAPPEQTRDTQRNMDELQQKLRDLEREAMRQG